VYHQTPPWPTEERERHNPDRLDTDLLALHRRRSIHAHCWDAEEMAAGLVGLIASGELGVELVDLFLPDDPGAADIEFGFVLRPAPPGPATATAFIDSWVRAVLGDRLRDPARVAAFTAALARDLPGALASEADVGALVGRPALTASKLLRGAQEQRDAAEAEHEAARASADQAAARLAASEAEVAEIRGSRTWRVGRAASAPIRLARRVTGRD